MKDLNVIFLDCTSDYPFSFSAGNTKTEFIARGLTRNGVDVSIIGGITGSKNESQIRSGATEHGINYYLLPFYKNAALSWLFNIPKLFDILKKLRKKESDNVLVISDSLMHVFITYWLIGRIIGYKIVSIVHEWRPSIKNYTGLRRVLIVLHAHLFGWFVDGFLPISNFLISKIEKYNKPYLKLPILADFDDEVADYSQNKEDAYFLYCAFAAYTRIIEMLIETYSQFISNSGRTKFIMVLSGSEEQIDVVRKMIRAKHLEKYITVKTKLPYEDLLSHYRNALGLLIPLDPDSVQDNARFSQKIAEYVSVGRPIITSNVGEIPNYFTSGKNAYIVGFSTKAYACALLEIENNHEHASQIGQSGRSLGEKEFNYRVYGDRLVEFFKLKIT